MGKKRRRLEARAKRHAQGEEKPGYRKEKLSAKVLESAGDSFISSLFGSILRAVGL